VEGLLSRVEYQDRSISSSSLATMDRESNGVVEGQTESGVSLLTTLATVEEIPLDDVNDWEQS